MGLLMVTGVRGFEGFPGRGSLNIDRSRRGWLHQDLQPGRLSPGVSFQNWDSSTEIEPNSIEIRSNSVEIGLNSIEIEATSVEIGSNSVKVEATSIEIEPNSVGD
jgi:hypothetical protein